MSTEPNPEEKLDQPYSYIRTFAKDFAALSGKPVEDKTIETKKKHPPKKEKPAKKKHEILERQTGPIVTNEQAITKPEDFSELELKGEKLEQDVQNNLEGLVTSKRSETIESLPRIDAGDIVSQETSEKSSDILARLKARAMQNKDTSPTLKPIVATAPIAQIEPIKPTKEESPSPLHTYTTDFEDHIHEEHASPFSVLAAQKDAPTPVVTKPVPQKNRGTTLVPIAGGIVLVILGIGAVSSAAYIYTSKNASVLSVPIPTSLITPDSRVQLSGSGSNLLAALAQESAQPIPNNSVVLTYVNESTTTPQGVIEEPTSGGALIAELNLPAPDILLRNIDPQSMVGIVSSGGETRPFFILRVESYERTFAGMLAWEPAMFSNLSSLYPLYPIQMVTSTAQVTGSSTTSTPTQTNTPVANSNLPLAQFVDETVASHDVRALKDNSGRTLVLYGYADKQTLIIARNEAAFSLLLSRL